MTTPYAANEEWIGGHLFGGNQLVLDFLNTDLIANSEPMELLPDAVSVARWLGNAVLVPKSTARKLERAWQGKQRAARAMPALIRFRGQFRGAMLAFEADFAL